MIEIFDINNTEYLNELKFSQEHHNNKNPIKSLLHESYIKEEFTCKKILSHYNHIYPTWTRLYDFRFIFKLMPDKPTMLPHQDFSNDAIKEAKGKIKRILIYVNSEWNKDWKGGTYFSEGENYKATRFQTPAGVNKKKFAENNLLIDNIPGRAVVFDVDDWHLPQEFSGNTTQRLVFGSVLAHHDELSLAQRLVVPNFSTGEHLIKID